MLMNALSRAVRSAKLPECPLPVDRMFASLLSLIHIDVCSHFSRIRGRKGLPKPTFYWTLVHVLASPNAKDPGTDDGRK